MDTPLYRYRFGTAEFDESRLELHVAGLLVDVEQRPLTVLAVLLEHAGEVVSRQKLLDTVWQARPTVDNVLSNAIVKLRKALGDERGERITTVPRVGYKLVGPIERVRVGRHMVSRLDLQKGMSVPGRENFRLQEQVSATINGEVWLARHFKTNELRVYKFSLDGEHLAALKREATLYRVLRESLGDSDHFVRILDWNLETQPSFLECEYGGENLVVWAGQQRLGRLSPPERISVFLQIASAVSAAHSVGVLHKDLKPTNILVAEREGGGWRLRVADFGSGRLLEPERLKDLHITQLGLAHLDGVFTDSARATPLYMAPELVAGHAPTVQSDVYSLGLILYQIMVGDVLRPMAPDWERDIADELLREDIASATAGQPERRLASVAELVHRLQRLPERRAERLAASDTAQRIAAAEHAAERLRARRPWLIGAVVSLALGLAVSVALYRGQIKARQDAEREKAMAEQVNRFLAEDLLGAADPSGPGGAHNPSMREVLAATASRLDHRFSTNPEAKAAIDAALGNAYFGMSDYAASEVYRRSAVSLFTAARGPGDAMTLEARYALASLLVQTNRLDEADKMLADTDRITGRRLAGDSELAFKAHWSRAAYYKLRMMPAKALTEYQAADAIRAHIDPTNDVELLKVKDSLSWCYERLARYADAERVLHDFIGPTYPPERVGPLFWAQARIDYGIALISLDRKDQAEKVMKDALVELRRSLGVDHFFVAVVQNELGNLYVDEKRWPQAVDSLREAYAILTKRSGEHGHATLIAAANLGIVEYRMGEAASAVKDLEAAHLDMAAQLGIASPQAESIAYYLALALVDTGQFAEAASLLPPMKAADLGAAEPRADWDARLEALRGEIMIAQGHQSEGQGRLASAVASMEALHTPEEDVAPFRKMLRSASLPNVAARR